MIWILVIINMGGTIWQSPYAYRTEEACRQTADIVRLESGPHRVICIPRPLASSATHED